MGGYLAEAARVLYTRTLDPIKNTKLVAGEVLLVDEANPMDRDQFIYSGSAVWNAILETNKKTDFRSRNSDSSLGKGIFRIVIATNNYADVDEFVECIGGSEEQQRGLKMRI